VLIIARHGRTAHNASGRLLGRLDPPLDEVGLVQAAAIADAVGPVQRIVSSPLLRTRQTADAVALRWGAEVTGDDRWIELDYGELDGALLADVPADVWALWRSDPTYAPPGGESLSALGERVRAAADELLEEARHADVLVVTHVSPIKAAMCWSLGAGDEMTWRMFVAQASIHRVAVGPFGPALHAFNEVAHLGDPS